MTRQIFIYTSQEAFYLLLISLIKNWPEKIEIEEELFVENNCVSGNSVYSMTVEMEIQFKLTHLFPLTPADHVALKSLPIFFGDKVIGKKNLFLLNAKEYHYFSTILVKKNGDCHTRHSTIYMLLSYYYFMALISIFPTPQLCPGPQHKKAEFKHRCMAPPPMQQHIPPAVSPEYLMDHMNCSNIVKPDIKELTFAGTGL